MKKIILLAIAVVVLFGGCYTQIGTVREDEGYSSSESKNSYYYSDDYTSDSWVYQRYAYRYYLPYPRYYLFFRYYTPGFAVGWGEWWYYDPWYDYYWWDWYWWDRYYWYSYYWYFPTWYYYPWWYRAPVIVIVNNPYYYAPGGGKAVVYRTRNFGSTRTGAREDRTGSGMDQNPVISPPSRTAPRNSGANVQSDSDKGTLRKPAGSGRETSVDRSGDDRGGRPRETGSTRTPSTPRVIPRSNDGNSGSPKNEPSPPQRTDPPRRTGTHRNSIQIYRDYSTGRSTLIEMPRHNFRGNNVLNSPNSNVSNQSEQSTDQRRHMGNRRR